MDLKPNLAKAIIAVMQEVKGIEKDLTVGTGNSSYKGVADQTVKKVIGEAMAKNGLCILPIGVEPKVTIDRWSEPDQYKPEVIKQKQSVFTEVLTKYLLMHESGESIELSGYGHGIDSQDKGAGKATTYSLKYTLLYTFLVPTGKIDDSDNSRPAKKNPSDDLLLKEISDLYTAKEKYIPADNVSGICKIISDRDAQHYMTVKKFLIAIKVPE